MGRNNTMIDLKGKNVLVTGATSFVAKHLIPKLVHQGATVSKYQSNTYDLTSLDAAEGMFRVFKPDYVIHLATDTKTKGAADTFNNNMRINLNVLECCQKFKVKKTLNVICDSKPYDHFSEVYAHTLHEQYKINIMTCSVTDLYGPHDTKTVGNLIKKIVEAKQKNAPSVKFSESGLYLKNFLYVEDAADLLLSSFLTYEKYDLTLNIDSELVVTVRTITEKIKSFVQYEGEIIWGPDCQIEKEISEGSALTPLDEGLKKTISWYLKNPKTETSC